MFLTEQNRCWRLSLSNFELNLLIKSLDPSKELTDRDNTNLDRIWKNLWGNRKRFLTKIHRGFCNVCRVKLEAHAPHEHPRSSNHLRDHTLYLHRNEPGWIVDLGNYELDLLIRSLDDEQADNFTDEEDGQLEKMLKVLWGIRRRFLVEIPAQEDGEVTDDAPPVEAVSEDTSEG